MSTTDRAPEITAQSLVAETLHAYPDTLGVFMRRRMHCPGCRMSHFMTLAEAAGNYGVELSEFLGELRTIVSGTKGTP